MRPAPTTPECHGERTGFRPSALSRWHRDALPSWAWAVDVDLVEVRHGRGIVAVAECAEVEGPVTERRARALLHCKPCQCGAVRQIAEALTVPGYFVLHDATLTTFAVLDLGDDTIRVLGAAGFAAFLRAL